MTTEAAPEDFERLAHALMNCHLREDDQGNPVYKLLLQPAHVGMLVEALQVTSQLLEQRLNSTVN